MKESDLGTYLPVKTVLALGYFDCVHRGHRALLHAAVESAERLGAVPGAITFDNDPSETLGAGEPAIYGYSRRLEAFAACGIELALKLHFDRRLMAMSARDFVDALCGSVDLAGVVCGEDYTFGVGAEGTAATLTELLGMRGIPTVVLPFVCEDGEKISTRRIRALLAEGAIEHANALLAEPFRLRGEVVHGRGEGRRYGCPTFNLALAPDTFLPAEGVYGTLTEIDGVSYFGVTNVGSKPTFDDPTPTVETHLVGYESDLYGKTLSVLFVKRLRKIEKFATTDALYAQIERDERWYL